MDDAIALLPHFPRRGMRDAVLGAVTRLFIARAQALVSPGRRVETFPLGDHDLRGWLRDHVKSAQREILAVTHGGYADLAEFLPSHELNQQMLERGVRMLSVYDYSATSNSPSMIRFLTENHEVPYLFGYGPVQIKVIDRSEVILDCPDEGGPRSLLCATDPALLEAALTYLGAVRATALPARAFSKDAALTPRQHAVAGLLASSRTDEQIAAVLGVSVRTVRSEVAQLCRVLGVKGRFAAGIRYSKIAPGLDG